jgi:uncharacterized damage-inducible protein DinB
MIPYPEAHEYNPYYEQYIAKSKGENVIETLLEGLSKVTELINSLTDAQLRSAYAEGKWTIKEVIQHMMDTERIFCYRALRFARNDKTNLPGFEQDDFVPYSGANDRDAKALLQEYSAIRHATIALFRSFSDEMLVRVGTAANSNMSVRAAVYIVAGHEKHHMNIINERYL